MGRLAALPENVIGGVDGVADGALIEERETVCDFCRRGLDGCAANFLCGEARAKFGLLDFDGDVRLSFRHGQLRFDRPKRQIVERRDLARHAVVIHGVRTVGGDLHLEDGVVAFAGDAFDCDAREREFIRKTAVVEFEVDEVAEPVGRKFH